MKAIVLTTISLQLLLSGCATMESPKNAVGSLYSTQQYSHADHTESVQCHAAQVPIDIDGLHYVTPSSLVGAPDRLSEGDRLKLTVAGDKDQLTGTYIVGADGHFLLLGQIRVAAARKTVSQLESDLGEMLAERGLIRRLPNGVKLQQVELAALPVAVSGAVFEPGTVRVGERQPEVRNLNISPNVSGDLNTGRTVSTALRAAGGIRPDAYPAAIYLVRGADWTVLDMSGAIDGTLVNDLPITSGDRLVVPSVGCLQATLVHPSAITAPGVRVYMSNLSRPAASNASSAIGKETTSLPYGTRLLQGLISANCVGGSAMSAGRSGVLISRNPVTGQSVVISRSVEQLVRGADRDQYDPYLMPGDSIACYDSTAMNLRDVVSVVSEAVTPYVLFKNVR